MRRPLRNLKTAARSPFLHFRRRATGFWCSTAQMRNSRRRVRPQIDLTMPDEPHILDYANTPKRKSGFRILLHTSAILICVVAGIVSAGVIFLGAMMICGAFSDSPRG